MINILKFGLIPKQDIPTLVLYLTAAGIILQTIAYFLSIPWYFAPVTIGAIQAGICYKMSLLSKTSKEGLTCQ